MPLFACSPCEGTSRLMKNESACATAVRSEPASVGQRANEE